MATIGTITALGELERLDTKIKTVRELAMTLQQIQASGMNEYAQPNLAKIYDAAHGLHTEAHNIANRLRDGDFADRVATETMAEQMRQLDATLAGAYQVIRNLRSELAETQELVRQAPENSRQRQAVARLVRVMYEEFVIPQLESDGDPDDDD